MKYSAFVCFTTQLHSQGQASLFLSGFTVNAQSRKGMWHLKTKILVADFSECKKLLEIIPISEKLRLESARVSLEYEDGAIILHAEVPQSSRFLAVRAMMENYLLLARFWQEELSPLTLLTV